MDEEIAAEVRRVMKFWTGTNCTWADDDVKALGILAGCAIRAGAFEDAKIPESMKVCIRDHIKQGEER